MMSESRKEAGTSLVLVPLLTPRLGIERVPKAKEGLADRFRRTDHRLQDRDRDRTDDGSDGTLFDAVAEAASQRSTQHSETREEQ